MSGRSELGDRPFRMVRLRMPLTTGHGEWPLLGAFWSPKVGSAMFGLASAGRLTHDFEVGAGKSVDDDVPCLLVIPESPRRTCRTMYPAAL